MIYSNAEQVGASLTAMGVAAGAKARAVTAHHGALLLADVKARASLPRTGPPGPRLLTGVYNRSINLVMYSDQGNAVAAVGTNAPQGRRLELGFTGVDALGRSYEQPPYPHFGPALDTRAPKFQAALAAIIPT